MSLSYLCPRAPISAHGHAHYQNIGHGQTGIARFSKKSGVGKWALPVFIKYRSRANGHCKCPMIFANGRAKAGTGMPVPITNSLTYAMHYYY